MFLELLNYDIEGAAWNADRTAIVDGAALTVEVKRRAETPADGVDGPATPLRIDLATLTPADKAAILAAYQTIEDIVRAHADVEYAAQAASPDALDAKIAEAKVAEDAKREAVKVTAAKQAELAALQRQVDAARAELAASTTTKGAVTP